MKRKIELEIDDDICGCDENCDYSWCYINYSSELENILKINKIAYDKNSKGLEIEREDKSTIIKLVNKYNKDLEFNNKFEELIEKE